MIAMVLFGFWHRASLLFIVWGCYHGVLLVLHRRIEALERRLDWNPPALWTPLSWITTISLVSLEWIFFRANSVAEAGQMLSALFSPDSYGTHFLSGSLYVLILALATAIVLLASDALEGSAALLSRSRWHWMPPLYVLLLLVVWVVTLSQISSAAQFMYRSF